MQAVPTSNAELQLPSHQIEVFQSDLQGICGAFDLRSGKVSRDVVTGALAVDLHAGIDIAQVSLAAAQVSRDTSNIRRDPGNHYFLILQHRGQARLVQNEVATLARPGDMFVVDSTKESQFTYGTDASHQISVHLPRDEMSHRFGRRIYGGLSIDRDDPLAVAMKAVLVKLMSTTDTAIQANTVEAFYSVLGAYLTGRALGDGGHLNPDRQIVKTALSVMAEHYRVQGFNSRALAKLSGVSLRRLQRAFQITGETPHERLQRFRVEVAHQALQRSSQLQNKSMVSTAAYDSGFGDLSTFYRVYRKIYGCTPGETLG
ncbi:MAG: helix-turn-helix domain-containing protein [Pseudomonadota bacterium]